MIASSAPISRFTLRIVRFGFAALVLLEALNYARVLHFTLVYTWLGLLISSIAVWILLELLHRAYPLDELTWFMGLIVVIADALGDMLHLYASVPHFDKYLHFFSCTAVTLVVLRVLKAYFRKSFVIIAWIAWSSVVALASLYELEEFWESVFFHTNRWGGGPDTLTDMTANSFGSLTALLLVFVLARWRSKKEPRG